ncbi:MAG: glycosyl transferase [Desulfuromonadaceae bacterium GWC2_58_13]|nr:MAG: glycosyl transferase [Desulfuromonadaceae bacterium GWC2_58_13]
MTDISIITATYFSESTLRDTLDSVARQEVRAEHIIVDGGSKDRTLEILSSYSHLSRIVSEPDRGIYDAMNKGIAMASGDVVGILNSDDFYPDHRVLSWVAEVFSDPNVDSCYGDLKYVHPVDTTRVIRSWKSGSYSRDAFFWGWMPPHPTFFVRRSLYEKFGGFNLDLGSAADYELMLRFLVKHRISAVYIPEVLVKMRSGGVSNVSLRNRLKANSMDRRAWWVNDLHPYPWTSAMKPLRKIGQFLSA